MWALLNSRVTRYTGQQFPDGTTGPALRLLDVVVKPQETCTEFHAYIQANDKIGHIWVAEIPNPAYPTDFNDMSVQAEFVSLFGQAVSEAYAFGGRSTVEWLTPEQYEARVA